MLAKKYDNYAWEEEQYQYAKPSLAVKRAQREQENSSRRFLNRVCMVAAVLLGAYLFSVIRSGVMIDVSNELVSLKQQEVQLINRNNELKIEVEQLKGPDRIIGYAEKQLGMNVARSNIYVKASGAVKNTNTYALADK